MNTVSKDHCCTFLRTELEVWQQRGQCKERERATPLMRLPMTWSSPKCVRRLFFYQIEWLLTDSYAFSSQPTKLGSAFLSSRPACLGTFSTSPTRPLWQPLSSPALCLAPCHHLSCLSPSPTDDASLPALKHHWSGARWMDKEDVVQWNITQPKQRMK